jgi:riboflavin biosynthesis pyrimidine reductase
VIVVRQGRRSETIDVDDRDALLDLYRGPGSAWLRLNLVGTVGGSAIGEDGTSDSITSRTDRRILGVIRELSDVVLVGAASVRAEGYQLPKRAKLAIATMSGDLGGHRIDDPSRVLVLGPEAARAAADASLGAPFTAIGEGPGSIVDALRAMGLADIVCEGGPSIAASLLAADLVDECCFTTAPVLGGPMLPLLAGPLPSRRLSPMLQLIDDDGTTFARWRVAPAD